MTAPHDKKPIDVFISYSRDNDFTLADDQKGWVQQFAADLTKVLRSKTSRSTEVWLDRTAMTSNSAFNKEIAESVRRSRAMVCLMSETYLQSKYCRQEVELFVTKARAEPTGLITGGNRSRLVLVSIQNIPFQRWPEVLPDLDDDERSTSLEFYALPENMPDAVGDPIESDQDEYEDRIRALTEVLRKVLVDTKEAEQTAAESQGGANAPFKVFLAHPADDMGSRTRHLRNELTEHDGIEVLPEIPPPDGYGDHAAAAEEAIRGADLAVHLLGRSPGEAIDDETDSLRSFPIEQARIGFECAAHQLILQPEELDFDLVPDADYRRFLEDLDRRPRNETHEVVRTNRHRMLEEVLERKAKIERARRRTAEAAAGKTAFVDINERDFADYTALFRFLSENDVTPTYASSTDREPGMEEFAEHLRRAQLLIIFFGSVERDWVAQRINTARKMFWEFKLDFEGRFAIYAPEKSREDLQFGGLPVAVDTTSLMPLLS